MQLEQILDISQSAMRVAILLCAPALVFGLVVGVVTNIFQAVTQITENTLAIVPKMLAMILALVFFSPWMLETLMNFTTQLFESIPQMIR